MPACGHCLVLYIDCSNIQDDLGLRCLHVATVLYCTLTVLIYRMILALDACMSPLSCIVH